MSILEVVVSITILLIVMLPMGVLLSHSIAAATSARQHQAAVQLADAWMEILTNATPPTSGGAVVTNTPSTPVAPTGVTPPSSTLAGTTFSVTAAYAVASVNTVGQSDLCAAGQPPSPSHPGVIELTVRVTWNAGQQSVSDTTDISYPKPGIQTDGFLAVDLANNSKDDVLGNSSADRLRAVPVIVTQTSTPTTISPNPYVLHADGNGCVFAQLPVGTYDVALGQPTAGTPSTFVGYTGTPPFVSTDGTTTDVATAQSVQVTAETVVQLRAFDEGIGATLAYGGASGVATGLSCPGTPGITCVATGNGTSAATATWGGASARWRTTTLSSSTAVNQVSCTSGSAPTCVAVGYGPGGATVATTTGGLDAATPVAVPTGVTDLTQVTCPSATGCYAAGTSSSGPVLLAGSAGTGSDQWILLAPPVAFASIQALACPTSTVCEVTFTDRLGGPGVLRLDGDPGRTAGNGSWAPAFTPDTLPATVTAVGALACPTATTCLAVAQGDQGSALDPTVITAGIGTSDTWGAESTFPTAGTSISALSCSPVACVATGSAAGAAAVWTADLTTAPHLWTPATGLPAAVTAVTGAACGVPSGGDSADCAVSAIVSSQSSSGQILVGSLSNGSWVWNLASLPAADAAQFLVGVACANTTSGADATCAATAATPGGPVVLTSASGPAGRWTDRTPASLDSGAVAGIAVQTAPAPTTNWSTQVAAGASPNATGLPNALYPQPGGYSVSTGDCAAEASTASTTSLSAAPGGRSSATLPLGLLPLQVVAADGSPVAGATVTLTAATADPVSGTDPCATHDAYPLPLTDPTGSTTASVPYGTYAVSVTVAGTTTTSVNRTLTVGTTSVALWDTTTPTAPALVATSFLPEPLTVPTS